MTRCGIGQKTEIAVSSVITASLAPRPKSPAAFSPASAIVSGVNSAVPTTVSPSRSVTRQTGSRATSSSHRSAGSSAAGISRHRASPPHDRPAISASTSPTCTSTRRPVPTPRPARSMSWASSAPPTSEPTRPPPGVMARASARSRALNPCASTTHATCTWVPARRQAMTLSAMPYTPPRVGVASAKGAEAAAGGTGRARRVLRKERRHRWRRIVRRSGDAKRRSSLSRLVRVRSVSYSASCGFTPVMSLGLEEPYGRSRRRVLHAVIGPARLLALLLDHAFASPSGALTHTMG